MQKNDDNSFLAGLYAARFESHFERIRRRRILTIALEKFEHLKHKAEKGLDQGRSAPYLRIVADLEGKEFSQDDDRLARVLKCRFLREIPSFDTVMRLLDANDKGFFEIEEEATPRHLAVLAALARATKHVVAEAEEFAGLDCPRVFTIQGTTLVHVAIWCADVRKLMSIDWSKHLDVQSVISSDARFSNQLRKLIRKSNKLMFGEMPRLADCSEKITLENFSYFAAETIPLAAAFAICGELMPPEKLAEAKFRTLGLLDPWYKDDGIDEEFGNEFYSSN